MELKTYEEGPLPLFYVGPDLSHGPMPTVLYFALSAKESLITDPFNQMVSYLRHHPVRIFSCDLPFHGPDLPATDALKHWAQELTLGHNVIQGFLHKIILSLEHLKGQHLIDPKKTVAAGLSRGAFIATHVAARLPWVSTLLGFAPLTKICYAKEFHTLQNHPDLDLLDLSHLIPSLTSKTLRYYISNRDVRVGTKECMQFIVDLAEAAHENKVRSPQIELLVTPPIGHQGHGTSKEVFEEGARWILSHLEKSHG